MNYAIGDRRKLSCEIRDEDGNLADPDTLTFTMYTPDDAVTTYEYGTDTELVRDSVGKFHVYWDCAQSGLHRYTWVSSGSLALVQGSTFLVGIDEDLTVVDVENYTKGRLSRDDPETQRALDAALARVRNYCGWHVSPVKTETMIKDGTNDRWLFLPTQKIVEITSVTECGTALDLTTVKQSADAMGILVKTCGHWRHGFSNIEIELSHGYTAAEAADFREAVLSLIDQASFTIGEGRNGPLLSKRVDDVELTWSGLPRAIDDTPMNKSMLAPYRILGIA